MLVYSYVRIYEHEMNTLYKFCEVAANSCKLVFGVLAIGEFRVERAADTFLRLQSEHWQKGVAFVNGVNIGRYWPAVGPQETLYVPAAFLRAGARNTLWLFELEPPTLPDAATKRTAEFVEAHAIRPDARPEKACRVFSSS